MTDLITVQRAFQLAARVLTTAEENEQTITKLRR
jgi:flagellar basal body rod protein FlgG